MSQTEENVEKIFNMLHKIIREQFKLKNVGPEVIKGRNWFFKLQ